MTKFSDRKNIHNKIFWQQLNELIGQSEQTDSKDKLMANHIQLIAWNRCQLK